MTLAIIILIGVAIGTLVELLLPGHSASELFLAMLLGTCGSLLARFAGEQTGLYGTEEPISVVASVIGAITILLLWGWLFRGRHVRR